MDESELLADAHVRAVWSGSALTLLKNCVHSATKAMWFLPGNTVAGNALRRRGRASPTDHWMRCKGA